MNRCINMKSKTSKKRAKRYEAFTEWKEVDEPVKKPSTSVQRTMVLNEPNKVRSNGKLYLEHNFSCSYLDRSHESS